MVIVSWIIFVRKSLKCSLQKCPDPRRAVAISFAEMFVIFVISALLVVVYGARPDEHFNKMEKDKGERGLQTGITDIGTRRKRAISILAKGALALRALLSGATPIYSSGKRIRNFEKNGNYFTALKDFESVDPHDVVHLTTRNGAKFTIGRVGDRKLKVKHPGFHGDTVFDIVDLTQQRLAKPGVPYTDRIIYRKTKTSD